MRHSAGLLATPQDDVKLSACLRMISQVASQSLSRELLRSPLTLEDYIKREVESVRLRVRLKERADISDTDSKIWDIRIRLQSEMPREHWLLLRHIVDGLIDATYMGMFDTSFHFIPVHESQNIQRYRARRASAERKLKDENFLVDNDSETIMRVRWF